MKDQKKRPSENIIRILMLEDNPDDVFLIRRILSKSNLEFALQVTDNLKDFEKSLKKKNYDLILCDFRVPGAYEFEALINYQETKNNKPFIFVSGTIGEEKAVEALKSGATDYVLKNNLNKLPVAINRALQEYQERQDKEKAEKDKNKLIIDLQRHIEELQNFANIISHNLRGPIASLLGLVSIFDKTDYGKEINLKIIDEIEDKCNILNKTLIDLKESISSVEVKESDKEMIHLDEITSNIETMVLNKVNGFDEKINRDFSKCQAVYSKKSYVFNILYNLVSNAIKHSYPGRSPEINISSSENEARYIISVRDNGIGMDFKKIDKKKIFNFYQRFNPDTEGKGLGLYLVKTQVEALKGEIDVKSQPGKGSTFTVYLNK